MWIKLHTDSSSKKDVLVGIVYRSHLNKCTDFLPHLSSDLEYLASMELPTVIMGDFNLDLMPNAQRRQGTTRSFLQIMDTFFFVQCVKEPTRITAGSSTLLDHLWTNCEERLNSCSTSVGLSDHRMISAVFNLKIKHNKKGAFTCRSYRGFRHSEYLEDLANIDWSIHEDSSVDENWAKWKYNFLEEASEEHP